MGSATPWTPAEAPATPTMLAQVARRSGKSWGQRRTVGGTMKILSSYRTYLVVVLVTALVVVLEVSLVLCLV